MKGGRGTDLLSMADEIQDGADDSLSKLQRLREIWRVKMEMETVTKVADDRAILAGRNLTVLAWRTRTDHDTRRRSWKDTWAALRGARSREFEMGMRGSDTWYSERIMLHG